MDLGSSLGPFMWVAVITGLLQIAMFILVIVVLLDIRRFLAEATPLMKRTNRWLARQEPS